MKWMMTSNSGTTGGIGNSNQLKERYPEKWIAITNGKVVIAVETKHGIKRSVEENAVENKCSLCFMALVLL